MLLDAGGAQRLLSEEGQPGRVTRSEGQHVTSAGGGRFKPPFPTAAVSCSRAMVASLRPIDVLLVTAIPLEYAAVTAVHEGAEPGSAWDESEKSPNGLLSARRTFLSKTGEPLTIAVIQAGTMGGVAAAAAAEPAIVEWRPRVVGMCGVCAGRRGKVALGDVVLADRVWFYDYGKREAGGKFKASITTYNLEIDWKQSAEQLAVRRAQGWKEALLGRQVSIEHQRQWFLNTLRYGDPASEHDTELRCPDFPAVVRGLDSEKLIERTDGKWVLTASGAAWIDKEGAIHGGEFPYVKDPVTAWRLHIGPVGSGQAVVRRSGRLCGAACDHARRIGSRDGARGHWIRRRKQKT